MISLPGGRLNGVCVKVMVGDGVIVCVGGCVAVDVSVAVGMGLAVAQLVIMKPIRTMIILEFTDMPLTK